MSNSATIRDVARAAVVSISTVSFVVNGKADKYRISH
ncbi:MAG: LacI family DNA-binding transcriptional regulator [bacterium]